MIYDDLAIGLLGAALALALLLLFRQRRELQSTIEELPTGLCVVDGDNCVQRWNRQMSELSGVSAKSAIGKPIAALAKPWAQALGEALASSDGMQIKQSLGEENGADTRWVILHSSPASRTPGRRQILVEEISDYQRLQDELLHKERLASIGRLAAGVAHEIGNPVTGIACIAQNLADNPDSSEIELGSAEILKQTGRISRTVGALMELSHPGSIAHDTQCIPCNLADCVDEAAHLLSLDRDVPPAFFVNRCDRELLVLGDSQLLLQVFLNLLDNARSAAAGSGEIVIDAGEDEGLVRVSIDNPGDTLPPEVLTQVFEPFFTTKDVGKGTGLGLALVRRMLEDMGGSISLSSPSPALAEGGVRAELVLPAARYGNEPGAIA